MYSIVNMQASHWPAVKNIYEEGIATGNASFETKAPSWEDWDKGHLTTPRLVALDEGGQVLGWAALSPVSGRCVYAGVAEVSVYVAQAARGKGVGRRLLQQLISDSEAAGLWTLQAGIFPENEASVQLHQQCGFRLIGRRERIGQMNGQWRDTLQFEKRSSNIGV